MQWGVDFLRFEVTAHSLETILFKQDCSEALSAEELARYLDLKKLDERVYMFEAISAYDG